MKDTHGRRCSIAIVAIAVVSSLWLPPQAASATFPGRNGSIAFSSDTGNGLQLFTVRPNGHEMQQITEVNGNAVRPDWSPDGTRIVFELDHPSGTCSVELVNADGSGMVDLSGPRNDCENDPSFAPDGQTVVFVRSTFAGDRIMSVDLNGGNRRVITTPPAGLHANDPNVSPDGAELSFEAENEAGKHALFVVDMDGSGLIKLVPAFSDVATKADWSPDGGRIIFSVNANEPSRVANVASIRPDGTGLRYLTDFPTPEQRAYAGSFSPDGRWIVFRFQDGGRYGLYRTGPEGGALHPILPLSDLLPTGNDWGASVTPS